MTLFRTVDPSVEPVTLAEAKAQLRIAHDSEDDFLSGLLTAAREEVEQVTGMALLEQSWRLTLDAWPASATVLLRRPPVRELLSVTIYGAEGEAEVLDPGTYELDAVSRPARLCLSRQPAPEKAMNGIEIDFSAGYGEAGTDVPDLLKRAIMVLVAHWYEFRTAFGPESQPVSFPEGYERLIAGYRDRRL